MRAVSQAQELHPTQESVHKDAKGARRRDEASLFCRRDKWLRKPAIFVIIWPNFSPKKKLSRNRSIVFLDAEHFITAV